jgi:hypothetical protein
MLKLFIIIQLMKVKVLCLFVLLMVACTSGIDQSYTFNHSKYSLISKTDSLHYLQISTDTTFNQWKLPYPVYQFQVGDIDNNGVVDMMVGVIKTTRFDSTLSKRLFIFQNYEGFVRPLWLGSRLGQPLVDFRFVETQEGPRIRSIEKEKSGLYLVSEYRWRSFGLDFTRYIKQEINFNEATNILSQTN